MDQTVAAQLRRIGWTIKTEADFKEAVEDFQRGYAMPGRQALLVDGIAGPKTKAELAHSLKHGGRVSLNFRYREFACKCGGRKAGCRRIRVHRGLVLGLEAMREAQRSPLAVVSGYRCPGYNAAVGGATSSQHLYGAAADVGYKLSYRTVARLRRFSGIGKRRSTGLVRHVDVRHLSGVNTTGGTPDRPTSWNYAS